ncbi:MAG: aminodeoxychorismate synthase component I, partial [Runella slithyformis]
RGKFYHHVRLDKNLRFSNPVSFMADSKNVVEDGFPGDVIGLYDTGTFKIGDTLTEGEDLQYVGIPSFSPEIFLQIKGNRVASFPMKGTIDAKQPRAVEVILANPKEAAEHATIVDLIRNDLSMVANQVWVERYRYIDRIETNQKTLLQVSSEVAGTMPDNWRETLGDWLFKLLPAGSICGAPKPRTLDIIAASEGYERGYYTGVAGIFDGQNLDSGVLIRFIENQNGKLVFKSGGGITARSTAHAEYEELIDKVYLPV